MEGDPEVAASRGERFDLASIIPPPVPDAENFAMTPLFQGLRNEMDSEYRRTHTGPAGSPTSIASRSPRTGRTFFRLALRRRVDESEHTILRDWQRYYREPNWMVGLTRPMARQRSLASEHHQLLRIRARPPWSSTNSQPVSSRIPRRRRVVGVSKYDPWWRNCARPPCAHARGFRSDTRTPTTPAAAPSEMKGASHFLALRSVAELDTAGPNRLWRTSDCPCGWWTVSERTEFDLASGADCESPRRAATIWEGSRIAGGTKASLPRSS